MRKILVIVADCPHTACKEGRLFDKWELYLAPAALMPDDSVMISKEEAEPILRLVMN